MVLINTIVQWTAQSTSGLIDTRHEMWALKGNVPMPDRKTAIVAGARQGIGAGWVEDMDLNIEE
jgi:hypothetical protein